MNQIHRGYKQAWLLWGLWNVFAYTSDGFNPETVVLYETSFSFVRMPV